jgi:hypothetical protein
MSKAASPLSSATTATSSSARTISAAAAAAEQRYIDRSAWLTFTSSNALSARGSRRNDLLPQLFDVASQRSPPQKNSARKGTLTVTNEAVSSASPMTRANNSWYASEHSYDRVDKIATHQISFDQNPERSGKRDVSSAARARKLKQTDPFSTSRDPAFTSERYTFQVSGTDAIRRDTAALRFHTLQVPDAQARLPCAGNTTSQWPLQASKVCSTTSTLGSSIVLSPSSASSISSPTTAPSTPGSSSRRSGRAAVATAITPTVWKTSSY